VERRSWTEERRGSWPEREREMDSVLLGSRNSMGRKECEEEPGRIGKV
jgi:hypothetical protein